MNRRRSTRFWSALAGATLIIAACAGDDDADDVISGGTSDVGDTSPDGSDDTTASTEADTETTEGSDESVPPGAEDVGEVGGSGCGIPHGPYEDPGEPSGEVRIAWNDPLLSFNTVSSRGNATANANPAYLMGLRTVAASPTTTPTST